MSASSALQLVGGVAVLILAMAAVVREHRDWRRRDPPPASRLVPPRAWRGLQRTTLPAALAGMAAAMLLILDTFLTEGAARPLRLLLGAALLIGIALVVSTALVARPRALVPPALRRRHDAR